jgi:hypothetical protein
MGRGKLGKLFIFFFKFHGCWQKNAGMIVGFICAD